MANHSIYRVGDYAPAAPTEASFLRVPRLFRPNNTVRAIVYCHGANGTAVGAGGTASLNGEWDLSEALGDAYPTIACDLGGLTPWANGTEMARIDDAINYLSTKIGCKIDKVGLVGVSMGGGAIWNYAKNHVATVACCVGLIPMCNMQDLRNRGVDPPAVPPGGGVALGAAFRTTIDTSWGVVYPAALPAGADPYVYHAGLEQVPCQAYHAQLDTICLPAYTQALMAAVGGAAFDLGAYTHGEAAVEAAPRGTIVNFFGSHLN